MKISKFKLAVMALLTIGVSITACGNKNNNQKEKERSATEQTVQKTDTIKVHGNCSMCQKRIEGALKKVEGIGSASWDVDTKMLTVSYDESKVNLDEIHQKVADVGHDTEKATAEDAVYNDLMGCCQYDRPEKQQYEEKK